MTFYASSTHPSQNLSFTVRFLVSLLTIRASSSSHVRKILPPFPEIHSSSSSSRIRFFSSFLSPLKFPLKRIFKKKILNSFMKYLTKSFILVFVCFSVWLSAFHLLIYSSSIFSTYGRSLYYENC